MKYWLETLGCKVNEYESNFYSQQLEQAGFSRSNDNPDILIVNTCTVTNKAAAKSRKMLRRLKRENPQARLVLIGCLSTFLNPEQLEDLDVDLVIGVKEKTTLKERVLALLEGREYNPQKRSAGFESMPLNRFEQHRAFLKVQDGCNQYCAYCQIPYARGEERSGSLDEIVSVAQSLADKGHKEIVLTGIHTGRYFDPDSNANLSRLLQALLENTPEDVYYRISSIEINEVSDELIELIKNNPRIQPHLHIPVQAAENGVLKRMRRPYTIEEYLERLQTIRKEIPHISISTDVIAGFVQESEEEFEKGMENIEKAGFSFLHVFGYSRREGTLADKMEGHLPSSTITDRVAKLLKLSSSLRKKDMARFSQGQVLVEEQAPDGRYKGHTPQYHPILIESDVPLEGRIEADYTAIANGSYTGKVHA